MAHTAQVLHNTGVDRVTPDLQERNTATDRRWAVLYSSTPQFKKRTLLTFSSSLRWVLAAVRHIAEHYSKMVRTEPLKHLERSSLSLSTRLRKAAPKTERRCFLKVILESKVSPSIRRESDFFSTVPPILHGGDWECVLRDLGIKLRLSLS